MVNETELWCWGTARGARCVVRDLHRADRIGGRPGHHAPPRPLIIRRNRYNHPAGTGSRRRSPNRQPVFRFGNRCDGLSQYRNHAFNAAVAEQNKTHRLLPCPTPRKYPGPQNTETRPPCRGRLRAKRNFPNRSRREKSRSPTSPDPALRRMVDRIDKAIKGRRSLESALAELEGKYRMRPSAELARMMEQLKAEIAIRKRRPNRQPG
jgi:hypothetical protein